MRKYETITYAYVVCVLVFIFFNRLFLFLGYINFYCLVCRFFERKCI